MCPLRRRRGYSYPVRGSLARAATPPPATRALWSRDGVSWQGGVNNGVFISARYFPALTSGALIKEDYKEFTEQKETRESNALLLSTG